MKELDLQQLESLDKVIARILLEKSKLSGEEFIKVCLDRLNEPNTDLD